MTGQGPEPPQLWGWGQGRKLVRSMGGTGAKCKGQNGGWARGRDWGGGELELLEDLWSLTWD